MTPQRQLCWHDPSKGLFGDCHRTCVAVILDLPVKDVPHFRPRDPTDDNKMGSSEQDEQVQAWLYERGLKLMHIIYEADKVPLQDILANHAAMNPGVPFILGCVTARGFGHSMVVMDGKIVCDPSGEVPPPVEDLTSLDQYWWVSFIVVGSNWGKTNENRLR